jgi:predicted glutamine amidotransferase
LLSDGQYVFAYCATNLHWITRKAPFGKAKLIDEDVEIDFQKHTTPNDVVTIISTMPLTSNEVWAKLDVNEAILFRNGKISQPFLS